VSIRGPVPPISCIQTLASDFVVWREVGGCVTDLTHWTNAPCQAASVTDVHTGPGKIVALIPFCRTRRPVSYHYDYTVTSLPVA
jgi:hypothetical protein